jgi:putative oxidoreductase
MDRIAGATHSLLRIVAGLLFVCPGGMKLFGWFGGMPPGTKMTALIWTGGAIELVGGLLIALGLFTRPAAFVCAGEMAVAYFRYHFPSSVWPIVNQGQPAVLYCFVFLFLWGNGAGPWSLDRLRESRS